MEGSGTLVPSASTLQLAAWLGIALVLLYALFNYVQQLPALSSLLERQLRSLLSRLALGGAGSFQLVVDRTGKQPRCTKLLPCSCHKLMFPN